MAKGIIVVDIPERCKDCPFSSNRIGSDHYCYILESIGYDPFHDVNAYACICPDCGLHIFEFTDDDVDDKCDSDDPEVMFKSRMVHHGYMGLDNFCNRCGRKLDWGEYHKRKAEL